MADPNVPPYAADARKSLVEELQDVLRYADGKPVKIDDVVRELRHRGPALVMLLLCMPFVVPVPSFGLSTPLGLAIMAYGLRMMLRMKPWVPGFIRNRTLSYATLEKVVRVACRGGAKIEKLLKPRMPFMMWPAVDVPIGFSILFCGFFLGLPLPIPGTNAIPAVALILLFLGIVERDGAAILAGEVLALVILGLSVYFANVIWDAVVGIAKNATNYLNLMMILLEKLFYLVRHLNEDAAWRDLIAHIGTPSVYGVLFAIIFLETGVVVLPFLPGDSLLFALGAISARPETGIHFWPIFFLLWFAAVLGDAVNYAIGKRLGPAVFNRDPAAAAKWSDKLLNRKHLEKAQAFYVKYGGKTIILARFVPVVRTFAPFVAGVGRMSYGRFFAFNVVGGLLWVAVCMAAGRLFGGYAFVQKNFELVIVAIIVISVLPMLVEVWRARRAEAKGGDALVEATTIGESPVER